MDNNCPARKLERKENAITWSRIPNDYLKIYVDETAWSLSAINYYKWTSTGTTAHKMVKHQSLSVMAISVITNSF